LASFAAQLKEEIKTSEDTEIRFVDVLADGTNQENVMPPENADAFMAEKSSNITTSAFANNVDPVEQKASSQIEGQHHLKESNSNPLGVSLEYKPICSCLLISTLYKIAHN
jgi:hypothetical protein